ncbi:MAG: DUF420 domain-containing protein [Verrucomicrobiota bacterium]
MTIQQLPTVNASLNATAMILLLCGWFAIRKGNRTAHMRFMVSAMVVSGLFLTCYLIYHYSVPHTKYQGQGILRSVYFTILFTHIPLAVAVVPLAFTAVWMAVKGRFEKHVKIVKWLWPIWMYVSVTGVLIYLMLYVF